MNHILAYSPGSDGIPVSVAYPDMHGLLALHYELMVSDMSPSHLAEARIPAKSRASFPLSPNNPIPSLLQLDYSCTWL